MLKITVEFNRVKGSWNEYVPLNTECDKTLEAYKEENLKPMINLLVNSYVQQDQGSVYTDWVSENDNGLTVQIGCYENKVHFTYGVRIMVDVE